MRNETTSERIRTDLLYGLVLGYIRGINAKIQSELAPGLDLFGIELPDQFKEAIDLEFLVVASGSGVELGTKLRSIDV